MKKLDISYFRKDLKLNIHKGISSSTIADFADEKYGDKIDFEVFLPTKGKNLQRNFVWTLAQKQELVLSLLKDMKLPSISVIISRDTTVTRQGPQTYKIIDGKQRLSTLISFYRNEFPLEIEGEKYFYEDLDESVQHVIRSYEFTQDRVYEYYPDAMISDDDKIKWFELINFAGTEQDRNHLEDLKS